MCYCIALFIIVNSAVLVAAVIQYNYFHSNDLMQTKWRYFQYISDANVHLQLQRLILCDAYIQIERRRITMSNSLHNWTRQNENEQKKRRLISVSRAEKKVVKYRSEDGC